MIYAYQDGDSYRLANMRSRFRGVGAWHRLTDDQRAEYGWYPVTLVNAEYDPMTQVRTGPAFYWRDGKLHAKYRVQPRPLDQIKGDMHDRLERAWKSHEYQGTTVGGQSIPTTRAAQERIAALVTTVQGDNNADDFDFRAARGRWVSMNRGQAMTIGRAVSQYVRACAKRARALSDQIETAETADALLSIDIESGWPV